MAGAFSCVRVCMCVCVFVCWPKVRVEDGEWVPWSESVPRTELEPHRIVSSDVVITTTDTVRSDRGTHQSAWRRGEQRSQGCHNLKRPPPPDIKMP